MNYKVKKLVKKVLPNEIIDLYRKYLTLYYKKNPDKWRVIVWEKEGRPNPPPHIIKQKTILKNLPKKKPPVFIETGTYMGDMVQRMLPYFPVIFTIELDSDLHQKATERFLGNLSVNCLKGNSGIVLNELLNIHQQIHSDAVFWLDGHYSGGITAIGEKVTPIYEELEAIGKFAKEKNKRVFIFIDDANLFTGTDDYPTLDSMENLRKKLFPSHRSAIENNILIWLPEHS